MRGIGRPADKQEKPARFPALTGHARGLAMGTDIQDTQSDASVHVRHWTALTLLQVLSWICYRDPERLNEFDAGKSWHQLALYPERLAKRGAYDINCHERLLKALCDGKLIAIRGGMTIPRVIGVGKSLTAATMPGFVCRRA